MLTRGTNLDCNPKSRLSFGFKVSRKSKPRACTNLSRNLVPAPTHKFTSARIPIILPDREFLEKRRENPIITLHSQKKRRKFLLERRVDGVGGLNRDGERGNPKVLFVPLFTQYTYVYTLKSTNQICNTNDLKV